MSAPAQMAETHAQEMLPQLRKGLEFLPGPKDHNNLETLLVFDPARNAYFRLSYPASVILPIWQAGAVVERLKYLSMAVGFEVKSSEVLEIAEFLFANELTASDANGSWGQLVDRQTRKKESPLPVRAAESYLFFRMPLVNPDCALEALTPKLAFIFSRSFLFGWIALSLLAATLILRQTGTFVASISQTATIANLPLYLVALVGLKLVHEIGHGVMAKRHGARVPSMGIAAMLGFPMFYTDTTDAWRIQDKYKRASIAFGGVGAEFLIAVPLLLLWVFLPDSTLRSVFATIATLSILSSLLVNLNPCMKFDGYFALSDLTGVPNLQSKGFEHSVAHLRRNLFGIVAEQDSEVDPRKVAFLITYGYATWAYRALLFSIIALLIYHSAFKALGIVMAMFLFFQMLLRPIFGELKVWWSMRDQIMSSRRALWVSGAGFVVLLLFVLPIDRVVEGPAILVAENDIAIHSVASGRVVQMYASEGSNVLAGQLIARIEVPDLNARQQAAGARITALQIRLSGMSATGVSRQDHVVLASELDAAKRQLAGLNNLQAEMEIRAPFNGALVDVDTGFKTGVWVGEGQELARVVSNDGVAVRALVSEQDVARLTLGKSAVFVSSSGLQKPTALRVAAISNKPARKIVHKALADQFGGPVVTIGQMQPKENLFSVSLRGGGHAPQSVVRGVIRISAFGNSPAGRFVRHAFQVIKRESGF